MKRLIKSIIIDIYSDHIDVLKGRLDLCSGISVVATANTIQSGIIEIRTHKPDLVFLDINIEGNGEMASGFDLFQQLTEDDITFKVILITAFPQENGLKSQKYQPIDFLQKPSYTINRLQLAIDKCRSQIQLERSSIPAVISRKLALNTMGGIILIVKTSDIMYAKADDVYSEFYTTDKNRPTMILKNLKQFEELLDDISFLRVSRSYLVNVDHIVSYSKAEQEITMTNGEKITLGKEGKESLLNFFNRLT